MQPNLADRVPSSRPFWGLEWWKGIFWTLAYKTFKMTPSKARVGINRVSANNQIDNVIARTEVAVAAMTTTSLAILDNWIGDIVAVVRVAFENGPQIAGCVRGYIVLRPSVLGRQKRERAEYTQNGCLRGFAPLPPSNYVGPRPARTLSRRFLRLAWASSTCFISGDTNTIKEPLRQLRCGLKL